MAKLNRVYQKLFGSTATLGQIGVFGSLAAGDPDTTTDPTEIQSLSQFLSGWYAAVVGGNAPAIQDMNALCVLIFYQLCYIMQQGIPEYNSSTTYYVGSLVTSGNKTYISLSNDNIGNSLTDTDHWYIKDSQSRTVTSADTATNSDVIVFGDTSAGAIIQTLPPLAGGAGTRIKFKNIGTTGYNYTIKGNGTEQIDGSNTLVLASLGNEWCEVYNDNGQNWRVIG